MFQYSRYIARTLAHSTLLTALSLTSIVWLTQALRLLDFIVNQGVTIDIFLLLTLLVLPSLLLLVLPIALFCAALFVYNKLRQDSELIVLEAAGISLIRLARPALFVAAWTALIGYVIAFYLMPVCYTKFRDMQNYLRNNYVSVLLQEGVFSTPVEGLTVFIRERDSDGTLHGILVHDNRTRTSSVTMMAEEGRLTQTEEGQRFLLTNGNRQEMKDGRLSLLNFESYAFDLSFYTSSMNARIPDAREMFLPELLKREGLTPEDIARRSSELHQRIIWPAFSFSMMLIGLAALLAGEFNRRSSNRRIVAAVLLVTASGFAGVALRNLTGISTIYAALAYLNLVIPAVLALYILVARGRVPTLQGA